MRIALPVARAACCRATLSLGVRMGAWICPARAQQQRFFSSARIQRVRGTQDWFARHTRWFQRIEAAFRETCRLYGFSEVRTPVLEPAELYSAALGADCDVVHKEMFRFLDNDRVDMALRPEGTAGVVRAVVASGVLQSSSLPQRLAYSGPMFRRERPQRGRYRQFQQVGVEIMVPGEGGSHAWYDVEAVEMGVDFLQNLGLLDRVSIHINALGGHSSRRRYTEELHRFLLPLAPQLSEDSRRRLSSGSVLRILDSKDPRDLELLRDPRTPVLRDFLESGEVQQFERVVSDLTRLGLRLEVDPLLVRGLDYYCHTIFEFVEIAASGQRQSTVLAGGRYDGLVGALGGVGHVGCVGWAAGVERLALMLEQAQAEGTRQDCEPTIAVVAIRSKELSLRPEDDPCSLAALDLVRRLRKAGLSARHFLVGGGNASQQLHRADSAPLCVLLGENEMQRSVVQLKNMVTRQQEEVAMDRLEDRIRTLLAEPF